MALLTLLYTRQYDVRSRQQNKGCNMKVHNGRAQIRLGISEENLSFLSIEQKTDQSLSDVVNKILDEYRRLLKEDKAREDLCV